MIEVLLKCLFAYLLGGVMGGPIISRLRGGTDLRSVGSGNIGATNALRTQGAAFAIGVLMIDAGKGALAAGVLPLLTWPGAAADADLVALLPYACGIAVALGHIHPPWSGFRGGKGAATLAGAFGVLTPLALPWMATSFVLVLVLTGYAGLSTLTAALTGLLYVTCFGSAGIFSAAGAFAIAATLLLLYTHYKNLTRLWQGTEPRFEKARLLHRWLGR